MPARWGAITLLLAPAVVVPLLVPLYDKDCLLYTSDAADE